MDNVFAIIGIHVDDFHRWEIVGVVENAEEAMEVVRYLNDTQDEYEYHMSIIDKYNSLKDFIYYNC